jgi:hypothetical protein
VSDEDFAPYELPGRVRCDRFCEFMKQKVDVRKPEGREVLRRFLEPTIPEAVKLVEDLTAFVHIEPDLPGTDKRFTNAGAIRISVDQTREEIIEYLRGIREHNATADLAFYAYRDMDSCDWRPFVKAAVERSPVSLEATKSMSIAGVYEWLTRMKDASLYDGNRLAQPDEVANYYTGDGLEKAFVLANVLRHRTPEQDLHLEVDNSDVVLRGAQEYRFVSAKRLQGQVDMRADCTIAVACPSCPPDA